MPQLRKDPITREWVVLATERAKRPSDFIAERVPIPQDESATCPFCPGNEKMTPPELLAYRSPGSGANAPGWWVRVVPNKYPALAVEGKLNKKGYGMYDLMNGVGAHEVIIETPEHDQTLEALSQRQVEDVLWAYRARYLDLKRDPRMKYILFFRNHGRVSGASLSHPHSQLIATPMVPSEVQAEIEGAKHYEDYRDRCVYCDIVEQELEAEERLVSKNQHFIAFEPYASRYPFETWVLPRGHTASFATISEEEHSSFAEMLREALGRISRCLSDPPYNYALHTAPCDDDQKPKFHWHLEILPRLTITAGFEMGTGIFINVVPPEAAAQELRAAGAEGKKETDAAPVESIEERPH
jgi:UDPglucose--hexose-1-phosphate uridylyltransferase